MNPQTSCETEQVRQLRLAQGLSLEALARHCTLSIRQLRQIEEGGHDAFYSVSIKQLAQRKVLLVLQDAEALASMRRLCDALESPRLRPEILRASGASQSLHHTSQH